MRATQCEKVKYPFMFCSEITDIHVCMCVCMYYVMEVGDREGGETDTRKYCRASLEGCTLQIIISDIATLSRKYTVWWCTCSATG